MHAARDWALRCACAAGAEERLQAALRLKAHVPDRSRALCELARLQRRDACSLPLLVQVAAHRPARPGPARPCRLEKKAAATGITY